MSEIWGAYFREGLFFFWGGGAYFRGAYFGRLIVGILWYPTRLFIKNVNLLFHCSQLSGVPPFLLHQTVQRLVVEIRYLSAMVQFAVSLAMLAII